MNLSEPLLIEDFHPRLKLGVRVAASIGCLFRIGVIHGRDVIKCMNFLVKSGFSVHRLSAIHAIVTMAGVKLCNPKYRYAGVGSVYRQLGSIYVDSGAYVWAPEGPSGPSYTLLMVSSFCASNKFVILIKYCFRKFWTYSPDGLISKI